jgi:hypothetical protein
MVRTTARVLGTVAAVASMAVIGSGVAFADVTAHPEGGGGGATYDRSERRLSARDTRCESPDRNVAAGYRWERTDHPSFWVNKHVVDTRCEDGQAPGREVPPRPSDAVGIHIRACLVGADGNVFRCGNPQFQPL